MIFGRLVRAALTGFALIALAAPSYAQSPPEAAPRLPCGGVEPSPPYAMPGAEPNVQTWTKDAARWIPPGCLRWPTARFRLIVALSGSFREDGDAQVLLARFGAVSAMRGLLYWSVTDDAWRVLVTEATALSGPDAGQTRRDFPVSEMIAGTALFFEERDNRSSEPVVYRLRVLEARPDRIVIETENVSPVRAFFVTLFPPGSLRAAYFLERTVPGAWSLYGLSAVSEVASSFAVVSEPSYINRAGALYRHFIGIPGDREPPLAK